ncbi:MAG TPA: glycoside hydrolase family 44 protein, partial [Bryobacteraceae bacterium]
MHRYVLFLLLIATVSAADGPALSVDASAARHPISPDIYGINDYGNGGLSTELPVGVTRWGGDSTTRYNWLNDSYNAAADWYFTSFPYDNAQPSLLPFGSTFDQFVDRNLRGGERPLGTIPMLDWLPSQRTQMCSFSVAKYGLQQQVNPYDADCGNGLKPDGKTHIVNDPADVGTPVDEKFAEAWVNHVVSRYGTAADGGVKFWSLDNEPEWWMSVHIDIHPQPATYDEMLARGIRYAAAVKSVDPSALVTGPVPSGWMGYFYSAADMVAGWNSHSPWNYDTNPVDRIAHGNVPWLDYYLQQMQQYEQQNGVRLLDYLDLHGYLTPNGIAFGEAGGGSDVLRLTSTRVLWDPNYLFPDPVINAPPRLIPRMRDWVANNYPGTKIAVTEYNWGAVDDITGAIAQADVMGIFGREGLDMGTMWSPPTQKQPAANAFRMYLNYDGL